jgi:hypothetical protein
VSDGVTVEVNEWETMNVEASPAVLSFVERRPAKFIGG